MKAETFIVNETSCLCVVRENGIIPDKTPLHRKRESTSLPLLISTALQVDSRGSLILTGDKFFVK